ncbi:MAG: YqgE/AlgH family protein, partial [Flavobacteriaceae bacterium]
LKSPDRPPCFVRFFLGYAGWDHQQLQQELDNGSWMVSDDLSKVLSEENPTALWRDQMVRKGGNYLLWANTPENPYNN